jgi:hypothetical protein
VGYVVINSYVSQNTLISNTAILEQTIDYLKQLQCEAEEAYIGQKREDDN